MNELLLNINTKLTAFEIISYFSPELICIIGIILNCIIYMFIIGNFKLKRLSDAITCSVFCINSAIITAFIFQGENFSIKNDYIVFSENTMYLKLFMNLFALFFVIITYKFTRKSRFKVPVINSLLILIVALSGILLTSDNFTFIYILLECITILIYKYASESRIKKNCVYSQEYITIGFCATCLFVMFYLLDYFVQDMLQKSIMQSCIVMSLLLKIGLFPIFNYSIDKKSRRNLPYSILLFCLLPLVGALAFSKIIFLCTFNEVCQLSTDVFILLCAILASFSAYKTKNLTGYLIYTAQFYTCFYILHSTYTKYLNIQFLFIVIAVLLALYSLLRTYKNNKTKTLIFSGLITVYSILIPLFGIKMLLNIYTFDKLGFITMNIFIFCNILIIIKTLKNIEGFYKKKLN